MSKNILLVIMIAILAVSVVIVGYFYTQSNNSAPIDETGKYESEIKMDDIYVDTNEKVVKPEAEKSSSSLDEVQIEKQMNELDNLDTEEVNIDELN